MWRDGGCLSKRKERQNGVLVSLPACAYNMVTRAWSGCGDNKKMAHDIDLRRAEDPQARHALTISFSVRKSFFFVLITVSVDGKEAWSVRSVDFEVALGRCNVRTNTSCPSCACDWEHLDVAVLPGSCPAMGYMHFSCSHLCHLSLPLFLDSLINNGGFVLQRGERHFLKLSVCLCLSLSLSLSFTIEFYGQKSIRSEVMVLEHSSFFFVPLLSALMAERVTNLCKASFGEWYSLREHDFSSHDDFERGRRREMSS